MKRISITLPKGLASELSREARLTRRPKSAVVREAIAEHLSRRERERFLAEIARAAAEPGDDAIALAEEALPLDNEALRLASNPGRTA